MFDLKTDVMKNLRSATAFHMPERVVELVNVCGNRHHREDKSIQSEFLDWHKQDFDWDNDDLNDKNGPVENTHPEIPPKIPGIELGNGK